MRKFTTESADPRELFGAWILEAILDRVSAQKRACMGVAGLSKSAKIELVETEIRGTKWVSGHPRRTGDRLVLWVSPIPVTLDVFTARFFVRLSRHPARFKGVETV